MPSSLYAMTAPEAAYSAYPEVEVLCEQMTHGLQPSIKDVCGHDVLLQGERRTLV